MQITMAGAGIAGLVSAWALTKAGHAVTVLESGPWYGSGASGKALGVLVPIGPHMQRLIDDLQRAGCAAWAALAAEIAAAADVPLEHFYKDWGDGRRQLRVPLVLDVLGTALQAAGARVVFNTELADFKAPGEALVLAAGVQNAALAATPLELSAGQIVRLRLGAGAMPPPLLAGENVFVVPDWDGSVLVGSQNWAVPPGITPLPQPAATEALLAAAQKLWPVLAGAEVVEAWVGVRPVSNPRLPLVRRIEGAVPTLAVAGLGKIGYALAPMVAAAVVAELRNA
jgi:glycine/D-amino acid oxidase-like deaminating enzyme